MRESGASVKEIAGGRRRPNPSPCGGRQGSPSSSALSAGESTCLAAAPVALRQVRSRGGSACRAAASGRNTFPMNRSAGLRPGTLTLAKGARRFGDRRSKSCRYNSVGIQRKGAKAPRRNDRKEATERGWSAMFAPRHCNSHQGSPIRTRSMFRKARTVSPSPGGEGRGEGGREDQDRKHLWQNERQGNGPSHVAP
jgi:hypothetical protein